MQNNYSSQDRISQKLSPVNETRSKKGWVIGIVCIFILLAAIISLLLIFMPAAKAEERNRVVTPDNVDEVLAQMQEDQKITAGQYEVTMNTSWEFEDSSSASSNAYVENSTANTNDVYFDVALSETDETIFESPIIPIGSHLENITLDASLSAGEHPCVLTYHLLNDEGESISTLSINLTIVIKN